MEKWKTKIHFIINDFYVIIQSKQFLINGSISLEKILNKNGNMEWDKLKTELKKRLGAFEFNTWVLKTKPLSFNEDGLKIEVPSKLAKEKLSKIVELFNSDFPISFVVNEIEVEEKIEKHRTSQESENGLNPRYVFQNFIVGKSNEFANAASEGVAISPGRVYNPLFIYGGVGLGKTHLMHAIGNCILQNNPKSKIHYCSSEQFTNDMINSLKSDRMVSFRKKYRELDLILIDDIQFIAGKESTQEEFFHTFNALHQNSKQIVLSSDRPPQEINNIGERLISRFTWGLIADIKPPDYETRVAILRNKAESENIDIPIEAIEYIAETVSTNIRELEGALNRVAAKASMLGTNINFQLIEDVFKGFIDKRYKTVTDDKVIKEVAKFYGVSIEDIKSTKRRREIAKARQVSMYFLRSILNLPFAAVGNVFGGKDHATVIHSVGKIEQAMREDQSFDLEMGEIKQRILKAR